MRTLIALGWMLVVVQACGGEQEVEQGELVPDVRIEPEVQIDGEEHVLSLVSWVGVSPAGEFALILPQEHAVRFFDANGLPIGAVGRDGEGPGEFRRPVRGGWIGDTLWVSDTQLGRVTLIAPDLAVARMVTRPPEIGPPSDPSIGTRSFGSVVPYAMYPGDSILAAVRNVVAGPPEESDTGTRLVRGSMAGAIHRDFGTVPSNDASLVSLEVPGGFVYGSVPFYPMARWAVAPDGSRVAILTHEASSDSTTVVVRVLDAQGEEVFNQRLAFEAAPIPPEVMDSAVSVQASRREPAHRRSMEEGIRERVPRFYPAADEVVMGTDGRVWIGLRRTMVGNPWLVLSPEGEPEKRVTLPAEVTLSGANEAHLYGIHQDSLGVESVVQYRILGPSG